MLRIFNEFPEANGSMWDFEAFHKRNGNGNIIIHAEATRVRYPKHSGLLSVKCAFTGKEIYEIHGISYTVDGSSYLIVNGNEHYSSYIESRKKVESLAIFFSNEFVQDALSIKNCSIEGILDASYYSYPNNIPLFTKLLPSDDLLTPLISELRNTLKSKETNDTIAVEEKIQGLFDALLKIANIMHQEVSSIGTTKASTRIEIYRRLNMAAGFMQSNLSQPLTLHQIANSACFSQYHFLRLFKQAFGISPRHHLQTIRMQHAKELLLNTNKSVMEICMDVGYENPSAFARVFRKYFGKNPLELKKKRLFMPS